MILKTHIDSHRNYYEITEIKNSTPTIFIHGVGLNHTMWKYQKDYFNKKSNVYYDLLNHGKTKKKYNVINFKDYNNQIIELVNY